MESEMEKKNDTQWYIFHGVNTCNCILTLSISYPHNYIIEKIITYCIIIFYVF